MSKLIESGKKIRRLIRVHGVESVVELTITSEGLAFRIPKTRKTLTLDWGGAVRASYTPNDVPAFLMGEPVKFLQHEVAKVQKKQKKKTEVM